jgi:hypothetical protein
MPAMLTLGYAGSWIAAGLFSHNNNDLEDIQPIADVATDRDAF